MSCRRWLGLLALVLVVGGCGSASSRPGGQGLPTSVPVGTADVTPTSVVWAAGRTIHVGDREVRTAARVVTLAPVEGGVFFVSDHRLWFTDLERTRDTGFETDDVRLSSDGGEIALLERGHGPTDRYDTHLALVAAYDTGSGRRLLLSRTGMGSVRQDDLGDLYEDAEPHIFGFGDQDQTQGRGKGRLLVETATAGLVAFALDGGAPRRIPDDEDANDEAVAPVTTPAGSPVGVRTRSGRVRVDPTLYASTSCVLGPGRAYGLVDLLNDSRVGFSVGSGRPVTLGVPTRRFRLAVWTGPSTVWGLAVRREPGDRPDRAAGLWSCDLRDGRCRVLVPASATGTGDPAASTIVLPGTDPFG